MLLEPWVPRAVGTAALLASTVAPVACDKKNDSPSDPLAASGSVAASAPAPRVEVPKTPWYVGEWRAEFEVVPNKLEFEQGGAIGWKQDQGKTQVGPAKLGLTITEAGTVTGKLSGALGERQVQGVFEADQLILNLESQAVEPSQISTGTITAVLDGKSLKATMKASSGDSQIVRRAEFVLTKADAPSAGDSAAAAAPAPQASATP